MIFRDTSWKAFFKTVAGWSLCFGLIALSGYLGYLNIQLKADAKVAHAEMDRAALVGQVEILQATIVKLQGEGKSLATTPIQK